MIRRNAYEHLRMPEVAAVVNKEITQSITIYDSSTESVQLYISEISPGKWSLGYWILFENGKTADKMPGDLVGWFKTAQDAQLYFLGYMNQYREYFSEDCIYEVKKQILSLIQQTLF